MICTVCGTQFANELSVCPNCGTPRTGRTPFEEPANFYPNVPPYMPPSGPGQPYMYPPPQPGYGSPQQGYSLPPQPGYGPPPQFPPPVVPPQPRKSVWLWVTIGIVLAVVLVGSCCGLSGWLLTTATRNLSTSVSYTSTRLASTATAQSEGINNVTINGTLVVDDPLTNNSKNFWQAEKYCTFASDGLHISVASTLSGGELDPCFAANANYTNIAYEAELTLGNSDGGGLIFSDMGQGNHYFFYVDRLGDYGLETYSKDSSGNFHQQDLKNSSSTFVNRASNQTNLLTVVLKDGAIDLYVNNHKIDTINDTTYSSGGVGLAVYERSNKPVEGVFSNVKVWTL